MSLTKYKIKIFCVLLASILVEVVLLLDYFLLATEYVLFIIILIDRFIYSSALVSHALYLVNHM
jgi:hypothetical protein